MELTFEQRQYIRDNLPEMSFQALAKQMGVDPDWLLAQLRPQMEGKRKKANLWSEKEDIQLMDLYGFVSFEEISAKMGRTEDAVKCRLRTLLHMEDFHGDKDFILLKTFGDLTGLKRGRMMGTLRKEHGLPVMAKGICDKPVFILKRNEAIEWLRTHQELYNGCNVSSKLFPNGIPDWLKEKRKRDAADDRGLPSWAKEPLTEKEKESILALREQRLHCTKIAKQLNLDLRQVRQFATKHGEPVWRWTKEELQFIQDNWEEMDDEELGMALNRPFYSVRSIRLKMDLVRKKRIPRYTKEETQYIIDHWQEMSDSAIGQALGRTTHSITSKREALGLVKMPREKK